MEIPPTETQRRELNPLESVTRRPAPPPILFGPDGLRAGWSILLYIVVIAALLSLAQLELDWFAVHLHQQNSGEFHPTLAIITKSTTVLIVVIATAVMARIEGHGVAFYGLIGIDRVRQLLIGIVSGFVFLSLLVGILVATHHLDLSRAHAPLGRTVAYAAAWALCFFLVGMMEELMLRGYLLFTLARGIRFWPAAVVLAALFGLMHGRNPGESPFGLIAAALIALVFSLSLWRLGHLWWAIGFHTAWDWAESYFYGTADSGTVSFGRLMHAHPSGALLLSGGATGPEGSAWILLIVVLAALFVWKTQPHYGIRLNKVAEPQDPHPSDPEVKDGEIRIVRTP